MHNFLKFFDILIRCKNVLKKIKKKFIFFVARIKKCYIFALTFKIRNNDCRMV